jgi:hypothetical protein
MAWADQVGRQNAFQEAHPDVKITPPPDTYGRWAAAWDEPNGSTTITRYELSDLLDELERRFAPVP